MFLAPVTQTTHLSSGQTSINKKVPYLNKIPSVDDLAGASVCYGDPW